MPHVLMVLVDSFYKIVLAVADAGARVVLVVPLPDGKIIQEERGPCQGCHPGAAGDLPTHACLTRTAIGAG